MYELSINNSDPNTMTNEINELISDIHEQVMYLQEFGVETFDGSLSEHLLNFAWGRSEITNLRSEIS